jgi:hypothetical protein
MRAALFLVAVLVLSPSAAWSQGSPVGPEFRINTYTTNHQTLPAIAGDSSGNFVVVWELRQFAPGPADSVSGQRYSNSGLPLGTEFRVNTTTMGTFHSNPAIAADPAGNFVVVWEVTLLAAGGLRGQRYASSGAPLGGEFSVGNSGYNFNPAVAADPAGHFIVVWEGLFPGDPIGRAVFGRRFTSTGTALPVFRVNSYTTGDQTVPSVAADSAGNFVVVWSSSGQDGSGLGIFGQRYDTLNAPLGSEFRVNSSTTNSQDGPQVAADSAGNFVVVWRSMAGDGSGDGVFGQRYGSSGAPLGAEFLVNTTTAGDQGSAAVAADASGNFVVTWTSSGQDGSALGIFGQRYDASGSPLGPEFRVNTHTTGSQLASAVAADMSGDFVVAWQSSGQDGSGYGIFGQRYLPILPVELMQFGVE